MITRLFRALPYVGEDVVRWIWGGFAVGGATLTRFFSFHFLVPFVIAGFSGIHLVLLHQEGSGSPLGLNSNYDKVYFHGYFTWKDLFGFRVRGAVLLRVCLFIPWDLMDPENFLIANPLVTPVHIQPEWYFLFAYAVLRSIPRKLGGVVALGASVAILWFLI